MNSDGRSCKVRAIQDTTTTHLHMNCTIPSHSCRAAYPLPAVGSRQLHSGCDLIRKRVANRALPGHFFVLETELPAAELHSRVVPPAYS